MDTPPARVRQTEPGCACPAARGGGPSGRLRLADVLCRGGRPAEALALAEAVLAEQPGRAAALRVRGEALARLGRLQEAQGALEAAWASRPAPGVAWSLALLHRRAAGPAAGLQWTDRALRLFPDDRRLLTQRAHLLLRLGRTAEAADGARLILAAAPEDGRALEIWAAARLRGLPPEEQAAQLLRLLQLPRLRVVPRLWALHARALELAGRPEAALGSWRTAADLAPGQAGPASALVFALRRCGRRAEAFEGLAALVRADPTDLAALSAFAYDARVLGRQGAARGVLLELLRGDPGRRHLWGWVRRLRPPGAVPPGQGPRRGGPARGGPPGSARPTPDRGAAPAPGRQGRAARPARPGRWEGDGGR